jgi:Family of unknown function (DUF6533)
MVLILDISTLSAISQLQVSLPLVHVKDELGVFILACPFLAILYYEYALTLPREIQYLWPPHNKLGWFTITCLLNRYLAVLGHIPAVVSYFLSGSKTVRHYLETCRLWLRLTERSCKSLYTSHEECSSNRIRSCDDLHTFRKILVVTLQIIAGSRFREASFHLTGLDLHEVLCLVRVYALYRRSRRILALLLTIGLGAFINASVCFFSLDPQVFVFIIFI